MAIAAAVSLTLAACEDRPAPAAGASSASAAAAGGDEDLLPPIEVSSPRPSWSLADVTDKQLERLVARAGWTPTVVGKTPPGAGPSVIRVAGFKKTGAQQLEAVVHVRCGKPGAAPRQADPGEAYFRDGACQVDAAVRLGIRNKSAESKRLLEALLGASPG